MTTIHNKPEYTDVSKSECCLTMPEKEPTELHGKSMQRVLKAIKHLESHHLPATLPMIAKLINYTPQQVQSRLDHAMWRLYVRRRVLGKQRKKLEISKKASFWEYEITGRGEQRYRRLLIRFGDFVTLNITQQVQECCLTQQAQHLDPPATQAQKPALAGIDRMRELDRLTGKGYK